MLRLARNLLGLIGALALMAALGSTAFVLARSNPDINIAVFFAAAGILYTMVILFILAR
ncbi:hypothetical protein [Methylopila sp. M107]|uniref:hypothetical protein n=1 Tax=Methylopila sp. M107 TaxID=1101190 RepID=UPI00035EEBB3|nr:hypothetical protein [Methylopila sp. M107]